MSILPAPCSPVLVPPVPCPGVCLGAAASLIPLPFRPWRCGWPGSCLGGDLRSTALYSHSLLSSLPLARSRPTSLAIGVPVAQGWPTSCLPSGVEFLILSLCEVALHCWSCAESAVLSEAPVHDVLMLYWICTFWKFK